MKVFGLVLSVSFLVAPVVGAVVQQNDFTPGENNTLPATLVADWNGGVNAMVVPLADAAITVPGDHTAPNDGYVLRNYDQGGYNFVFPASYASTTRADSTVEAWVYVKLTGFTGETDYGLIQRGAVDATPDSGALAYYSQRAGYWFMVTANSSWGTYVPTNRRAFLLKRNTVPAWETLGTEGTTDIADGWHLFRLTVSGTNIYGYIDGALQCQATDSQYASGFPVMIYYGADATKAGAFDNFVWTDPNADVADWSIY
jgi:hypothetical protein